MWRLVESDFADVLITDVGLPDGDALDILPKLQKNNPNLKIIVMSANILLMRYCHLCKPAMINLC